MEEGKKALNNDLCSQRFKPHRRSRREEKQRENRSGDPSHDHVRAHGYSLRKTCELVFGE